MITKYKNIEIGSRVRLKEDVDMPGYMLFHKGHEFTVYDSSYRGWDLVDDEDNKLDETLFIDHLLELVER